LLMTKISRAELTISRSLRALAIAQIRSRRSVSATAGLWRSTPSTAFCL